MLTHVPAHCRRSTRPRPPGPNPDWATVAWRIYAAPVLRAAEDGPPVRVGSVYRVSRRELSPG